MKPTDKHIQRLLDFLQKIAIHIREFLHLGKIDLSELFQFQKKEFDDLVGLVIDTDYLKILKIDSSTPKPTVECYAMDPLPPGTVVNDEIKNGEALAQTLQRIFKRLQLHDKNVALAIPRSSAIVKNIMVNKHLNADEIESRVWVEAGRLFPDLINNIYLDFVPVGVSEQDNTQLDIILVACRKDRVKPYLDVTDQAGLNARIVDLNCYALERALAMTRKKDNEIKTIGLLNLSISLSTLIVVSDNQLIYTHELNYDGQSLMKQVQLTSKQKETTYELEVVAMSNTTEERLSHSNQQDGLNLHLRHMMQFFYSSRPNMPLQKMLISGDCAVLVPELAQYIEQQIGIKTELANPFEGMNYSPAIAADSLKKYAPALMLCCGLAFSKIDWEGVKGVKSKEDSK